MPANCDAFPASPVRRTRTITRRNVAVVALAIVLSPVLVFAIPLVLLLADAGHSEPSVK